MLTDGDVTLSEAMSGIPAVVANYVWKDDLIHMINLPRVLNTGQLPPSWFQQLYDNAAHNQNNVFESYRVHRTGRHGNAENMATLTTYFRHLYDNRTPATTTLAPSQQSHCSPSPIPFTLSPQGPSTTKATSLTLPGTSSTSWKVRLRHKPSSLGSTP